MIDFSLPTALYGGSFDPVHEGHLHVARSVRRLRPEIKQIVFVPASVSPGKPAPVAPGKDRLYWLSLVALPEGFPVWEADIQRGGDSFTIETLEEAHHLGAEKHRLFWIIGADSYSTFSGWKQPDRIRNLSRLLVVNRPGTPVARLHADDEILAIPPHPASSTALRADLRQGRTTSPDLPAPIRAALEKFLPGQNPYVRKN